MLWGSTNRPGGPGAAVRAGEPGVLYFNVSGDIYRVKYRLE